MTRCKLTPDSGRKANNNMKEHPILFSGEMVKAILRGHKTQTRRVINPQPRKLLKGEPFPKKWYPLNSLSTGLYAPKNKYGCMGQRLWVRENACYQFDINGDVDHVCEYTADISKPHKYSFNTFEAEFSGDAGCTGNTPSIFMPRWASRITLEILSVHGEQVQDISNTDAIAEGCLSYPENYQSAIEDFQTLWNQINIRSGFGWDINPWVWVIEFKRVQP